MSSPVSPRRRPVRTYGVLAGFALLALASHGCASASGEGTIRRSGNVISAEELQEAAVGGDAFRVVERLRPGWLRVRSGIGGAVIFLNGQRYGEMDSLRTIPAGDLESARLLSAADATTLYGTGYPAGIIDLRTRRR